MFQHKTFFLSLLLVLVASGLIHSIALVPVANYASNAVIQDDFSVIPSAYTIASLSYNLTPLIQQNLISPNCSGLVVSNGTDFNATHKWVQNFVTTNCLSNGQNSTILVRFPTWNNQIKVNFTLLYTNTTVQAGMFDWSNASQVFKTYGAGTIYNSTGGSGNNYTDFANNLQRGLKSSTTEVTDFPNGYGVNYNGAAFVSWADNSSYKPTNTFSLVALVKPNPSGSYVMFGSHGKDAGNIAWESRERPDGKVEVYGVDTGTFQSTGTLTANQLYLITIVVNGGSSAIYINKTITTGTLTNVAYSADEPVCVGGQSYASACHAFDAGEESYFYLINDAVDSNYTNSTVDQSLTYYGSVVSYLNVTQPVNTNYTSFTIPTNVTSIIQTVNVSITSSSCGSTTIYNLAANSFNASNLTCSNNKNNWIQFNATSGTSQLEVDNVSFYILAGATFSLINGGNSTNLTGWTLNVTNGTYTQNYTNQNNPLLAEFDTLPLGTLLNYSFNPQNSQIFYPDNKNLNGQFNNTNHTFASIIGKAWFRQDFYAGNDTSFFNQWNLNASLDNGTTLICSTTIYNCNFSLEGLVNHTVTFTAFNFGYGNQTLIETFNSSSPYSNHTFNLTIAGLNFTVYEELNKSIILNGTFNIFNGTFAVTGSYTNTSQFLNYTQLPTGTSTACFQSQNHAQRCYLVTLTGFTAPILEAFLPNTAQPLVSVIFVVKNTIGTTLSGVNVIIQLLQNGNFITVGSGATDSTGSIIFTMNANNFYGVTATNGVLTTSLSAFQPAGQTYTIILGGNSTFNYTYVFQNVSFFFTPASFNIQSNPINIGCGFTSFNGSLTFMQTNISSYNSTNNSFNLLISNSSTNPNGVQFISSLNTNNYSLVRLDCCFVNLANNPYCISYNYSIFNPKIKNNVSSIFSSLGGIVDNWLFKLILILACAGLAYALGQANELYGVATFLLSLAFFSFIGFLNPLVSGLVFLVGIIAYFQLYRNVNG